MKTILKKITIMLSLFYCAALLADTQITTTTNVIQDSNKTSVITTTTTNPSLDEDIVSAINAKYAKDAALIGTTLIVSSKDGIVTLSGSVTAQAQADEAVQVAKSIPGVKDVRSSINVKTNPPMKPFTNIQPNYLPAY